MKESRTGEDGGGPEGLGGPGLVAPLNVCLCGKSDNGPGRGLLTSGGPPDLIPGESLGGMEKSTDFEASSSACPRDFFSCPSGPGPNWLKDPGGGEADCGLEPGPDSMAFPFLCGSGSGRGGVPGDPCSKGAGAAGTAGAGGAGCPRLTKGVPGKPPVLGTTPEN